MTAVVQNNQRLSWGRIGQAAGIAIVGAIVVNVILYLIFAALDLIPEDVEVMNGQGVTVVPVIFSTFTGVLGGSIVFAVLSRIVANPVRVFQIIALVVLVLSFAQPVVVIQDAPIKMIIALNVLHVAAAAITIWSFSQLKD